MPRKKTVIEPIADPIAPEVAEALAGVQNTASELMTPQSTDLSLVNQLLGQAQMAGAFEDFSRTVRISKLAYVKENKLYKEIKGQKLRTGAELLQGTWADFCGLLGRSVDQIDRDIANLRTFGEEALESMHQMGIGYREMRQYQLLQDDERAQLVEVAKNGDKEALVEFAETVFDKHSKEKQSLTKKTDQLQADIEAKDAVAKTNRDTISKLQEQVARISLVAPDEISEQLRAECSGHADKVEDLVRNQLQAAFAAVFENGITNQANPFLENKQINYLEFRLDLLEYAVDSVRDELGLERSTQRGVAPTWSGE